MKKLTKIMGFILLMGLAHQVQSQVFYLTAWSDFYPNSTSDDRSCQLCHANSITLVNGFPSISFPVLLNGYGADLESAFGQFDNFFELNESFEFIEGANSDADSEGLTNLEEINRGLDPGWTAGFTNRVRPVIVNDDPPPFADVDGGFGDIEVCFPVRESETEVSTVCI